MKTYLRQIPICRAWICMFFFCISAATASGQCDSMKQYMLQYADEAVPIGGSPNSGVPISDVFPDYTFYSVSDSAVAKYWVSNITHNGARVYLDNWCQGKSVDIEEMTIPQSRTKTVRISPGDRVKIFREFWWYEPYTKAINPGAYLGTTNVSYSIEILDAVSGVRIAQLDTLFLRAKNESSAPYFFSLYPAIALIEYEYPTHLPERNIVIAIRARQRGKANFPLYRIDGIAISHTRDLQSDTWKKYAADLEQLTIAPR